MKTPRFWQHRSLFSVALTPLAYLYRLGAYLDRCFTASRPAPLPVISIGNATAGGAGKTPTTIAIIPLLHGLGYTPHILTRGYRGAAASAHRVMENDRWQLVGDEALLLAVAAPTWVGSNRLASAHAAAKANATLLVCDDAHQHHALAKTLSLLVIDGAYGVGNGQLLPAGPLREPLSAALSRTDAIILIGEDVHGITNDSSIPVFRAAITPIADTSFLAHKQWLAFAGIGRPEKFYTTLRQLGAQIIATHDFPDHHAYSETDIATLFAKAERLGATLITTQKDVVKLPPLLRHKIQVLPVSLTWQNPGALADFLKARLPAHP